MTPQAVTVTEGQSPVILAFPHDGTWIADAIAVKLNRQGQKKTDTDWHIHRLYDGLLGDATYVRACFHRYVIDANRDPGGGSLYPGQNTTALIPLSDFDGESIWQDGQVPNDEDIKQRLADYHAPYHQALQRQITRLKKQHPAVVLYDCHSIRDEIPFLFQGKLPRFNIGDNDGTTCAPVLTTAAAEICRRVADKQTVVNGRFKGGWTTRHYGRPQQGIHALQMELAQSAYLQTQTPPFAYDEDKAEHLREILREILQSIGSLAQTTLSLETQS